MLILENPKNDVCAKKTVESESYFMLNAVERLMQ